MSDGIKCPPYQTLEVIKVIIIRDHQPLPELSCLSENLSGSCPARKKTVRGLQYWPACQCMKLPGSPVRGDLFGDSFPRRGIRPPLVSAGGRPAPTSDRTRCPTATTTMARWWASPSAPCNDCFVILASRGFTYNRRSPPPIRPPKTVLIQQKSKIKTPKFKTLLTAC